MNGGTKHNFSNRLAIVVGGSSGIGLGVTNALIASGAKVVCASRNPPKDCDEALFIKTDISRPNDVENLVQRAGDLGVVDFLVYAAGQSSNKSIEMIEPDEWDQIQNVNIKGLFLICRLLVPIMRKAKNGKIIAVSSIAGRNRSRVAGVHYSSSKAGMIGFIRQLALELKGTEINANVVCPSQTMTPMLEKAMDEAELAQLRESIPKGYIASVEEQVAPILFLLSEDASYVHGAIIDVNGGQL